ncbi:S9 family peptidase [Roseomonas sp. OT10]|uniref:alpha/beta hydrolase n=1 Tax=Roseomonas cutis TaxID=2897332 RepID=UPI001E5AB656|nr:alpha/beta fold hydrolase [Roseomonas sp. OT10]UFN50742.1 S9 family peptidase [Roseomonas sp. OT10]
MPGLLRALLLLLILLLSSEARAACALPDLTDGVETRVGCLALRFHGPAPRQDGKIVVLIHGNGAPGGKGPVRTLPLWAPKVVAAMPGASVIALYRPGYGDMEGRVSDGSDGGRDDNWTADNIDAVADALRALRERYRPQEVVVLAHSGGAAVAANILGRAPGLIDRALLLGCPCSHAQLTMGPYPRSLDPMDIVSRIPTTTRVLLMTGSKDKVTNPAASLAFVAALSGRGVQARFEAVPDGQHELTLDQFMFVMQRLSVFAR